MFNTKKRRAITAILSLWAMVWGLIVLADSIRWEWDDDGVLWILFGIMPLLIYIGVLWIKDTPKP